jgi:LacI family transcriptional regulator
MAAAEILLARNPRPTVIICGNDVVAMGTLNAARELGVSVPTQVSVVGFDDLPQAAWPLIQLATVAFDLDAMARTAAGLLVKRAENASDAAFQHAIFPSRLVKRGSLGPAP